MTAADPRWGYLDAARPALLARFAGHGVARIEFVAAFPDLDGVAVWLCTATDAQRDALGGPDPCLAGVRGELLAAGFPPERLGRLTTVAQSQETVDRDYQGNWFYALR